MHNKQQPCDLFNIRYGWLLSRTPRACAYGSNFDIEHSLTCKKEAFITLGHNRLRRNVTVTLLYKRSVWRHSHGTQITKGNKQTIWQRTANTWGEAGLDVAKIFDHINIFSESWCGSWVRDVLLSISWNDSIKVKARILHHNVLVPTKNLLFSNEIDFLMHM